MTHKKVSDVMTAEPISVHADMPFHDIAGLLAQHKVSAVPVVDADQHVVGVVSEADLLHKIEYADGADGTVFARAIHRTAIAKAAARTATDLMTAPAVTIPGVTSVVVAAKIMEAQKVKRLPVIDDLGRLIGIVSRGDLLKVFLRTDAEIHDEIVLHVFRRLLWIDPSSVTVTVDEGVVDLAGTVEVKSLTQVAARLVHGIDGVTAVNNHLTYHIDDTKPAEARYYRPLV